MVHLETQFEMAEYYKKHLQEYFKEHPGEYVLIERHNFSEFKVSFFEDKGDLEKAVSKYAVLIGPTVFTEKIPPSNTHRFNKNNHNFYFSDRHLKYCPNDKKREMPLPESHTNSEDSNGRYKEMLYCKDCGCFIERKPSEKAIKKWQKEMKNMLIGNSLPQNTHSNKRTLTERGDRSFRNSNGRRLEDRMSIIE